MHLRSVEQQGARESNPPCFLLVVHSFSAFILFLFFVSFFLLLLQTSYSRTQQAPNKIRGKTKEKHQTMTTLSAQPRFLRSITLDRANKFSSANFFSDINLYSRLYSKRASDAVELSVYSVPELKRIPFERATKRSFSPTSAGSEFGPSWVKKTRSSEGLFFLLLSRPFYKLRNPTPPFPCTL